MLVLQIAAGIVLAVITLIGLYLVIVKIQDEIEENRWRH